jgi:hypothetical protein
MFIHINQGFIITLKTYTAICHSFSPYFHSQNYRIKLLNSNVNVPPFGIRRKLVLLSLNFNILYKSEHIPGKKNVLSDALSHLQIQKFLHMIPEAEKVPTSVQLLPQLPN